MANVTKLSLIKVVELALICIIIGLHANSPMFSLEDSFLSAGTEVGFLIILTGLFAAAVMGTPVNHRIELGFLVVGCALFIASGAVVLEKWQRAIGTQHQLNMVAARGSISIIEGILLLVDGYLMFKREE
ncbi:uncharacterized protein LOC107037962 [Diachasma alloeum]|uniref:uncharacterized protein LOC107037962 n=1 Tax=Diachasma alloeum TaxID=454923 RepID=UPI000738355E|nr:uncharacterized protein LOC107037962 [Diachasma alloeum]